MMDMQDWMDMVEENKDAESEDRWDGEPSTTSVPLNPEGVVAFRTLSGVAPFNSFGSDNMLYFDKHTQTQQRSWVDVIRKKGISFTITDGGTGWVVVTVMFNLTQGVRALYH